MFKKHILAALLINIYIISLVVLFLGLISINNIGADYIGLISVLAIMSLIFIIGAYLSRKTILYNSGVILTLILTIISIYSINSLNNTYSYLRNLYSNEYSYKTYSVYVKKETTTYSSIDKLKGKKIGMLETNSENIIAYLDNISEVEYATYKSTDELIEALSEGQIQSFIVNNQEYNKIKNKNNIKGQIRTIYTNKIKEANI